MPENQEKTTYAFIAIEDEEDDGHWSQDPRAAEDRRREEEEPPALRLTPSAGKKRRSKKEPLPKKLFIIVDGRELRRTVREWEARHLGMRIAAAELKKLVIRSRVRENSAKSEAQAASFTRWWLRNMWQAKKQDDLPPDPDQLRAFPKAKLAEICETLRDELLGETPPTEEQQPPKKLTAVGAQIAHQIDEVMREGERRKLAERGLNPDSAEPPGTQLVLRPLPADASSAAKHEPKCGQCGQACVYCTERAPAPVPPPVAPGRGQRPTKKRPRAAPVAQLALPLTPAVSH
ncbi:hypothetical protein EPN90_00920 [Patescibacteria group bacterium]|nr:MAG: hypothetical protein EPN90_00920 [Patescibacteria group bacterium]